MSGVSLSVAANACPPVAPLARCTPSSCDMYPRSTPSRDSAPAGHASRADRRALGMYRRGDIIDIYDV